MDKLKTKVQQAKSKLDQPRGADEDHPANFRSYDDGQYLTVDLEAILPNPDQPRKFFDEGSLNELATSIKEKGVLQPVIIRKDNDGQIFLVAGERRFRAAQIAGLEKIPAIITKGNPAEIALIENLQREDLKPVEEAEALSRMVEEYGYTQDRLAQTLGKAKSTISEIMSLNRLPDSIKEEVRRAELFPRRLLVEIAKQETPEAMLALFTTAKDGNLRSDQIRDIARPSRSRDKNRTPAAITLTQAQTLSKHLAKLNLATIEETEKVQLLLELQTLKTAIDELLQ